MTSATSRVVLAAAVVCLTAVGSQAQQTTTATETKAFEVIAVDGNTLVVSLPEGTRELKVADDFRFMINGKPMCVRELTVGMKGTATITTNTTVTPVTVTEVKNGTVQATSGTSIIVRTPEGIKSFTQGDIDKRGVKIMRNGKPAGISDFRTGDNLSATIITSRPPTIMTQQQVDATLAAAAAPAAPRPAAAAPAPRAARRHHPRACRHRPPRRGDICAEDTAEYRQFVADARAREHRVTRDGAHADDRAPLRPVGCLAVAGTAFAPRHVNAVTGAITEQSRSTVRHGSCRDRRDHSHRRSLQPRAGTTCATASASCFRISGGGQRRCSASSSSEFCRFSRLVRA